MYKQDKIHLDTEYEIIFNPTMIYGAMSEEAVWYNVVDTVLSVVKSDNF